MTYVDCLFCMCVAFVQSAQPNLSVLEEYRRREAEYNERVDDLNAITRKRDDVKSEVERLRKQRLDEFMHGFNIISQKLKEMYQVPSLFGWGGVVGGEVALHGNTLCN